MQHALSALFALVTGLLAQDSQADRLNAQPLQQDAGAIAYQPGVLSASDRSLFQQGLAQARARDVAATQTTAAMIADPTARKLVLWALVDTSANKMSFAELAQARTDYAAWPRGESRVTAGEEALDRAGGSPETVLAFFGNAEPTSSKGMIALAGALDASGRTVEAQTLVRDWWRTRSFEASEQTRVLGLYGQWLTQDDHDKRLDMMLLGPQGPATRAMVALASPEAQIDARARMALRSGASIDGTLAGLTPKQAAAPGVFFERLRRLRNSGQESQGIALLSALHYQGNGGTVAHLPAAPMGKDAQDLLWTERRNYFVDSLQAGDGVAAYYAMAGHGFPAGARKVDAEFWAGWAALVKLNDPARAARHFAALQQASSTPITQGRARYWQGRAAEAAGDAVGAQTFYAEGAQYIQTFYGQLAAEKTGATAITLPADPEITDQDRTDFEANEVVKAARILGETGETSLFRVFAYHLDDTLPAAAGLAQVMDMSRGYGEGFTAMMVGRAASQRGWLMPDRQYPIRIPPVVEGAAPLEFTLAITRQESSFDPRARSHADARGMMQFLPATARSVARQIGMSYSAEQLWDPDYNMTLGSYHLGDLTRDFGGSYLLAIVGYNAGPGRPRQWIPYCGDPRGGQVDPINFLECAPFTETRDYMMRVMENMQVYRARINGGTAPLTLSQDLARGVAPSSGPVPYDQLD